MKRLLKKPYIYWVIGIFLVYITLNVILSQFYSTIAYLPYYLNKVKWVDLILSIFFSTTIGILIAMNMVFAYIRHKEKKTAKECAMTSVATIGGFSTGICSACMTGAIPLIFSLAGVTLSWGELPFKGMEIQVILIGILGGSIYLLKK